jgi:4-hydroxy-2-oxoheptanedioate aldolase
MRKNRLLSKLRSGQPSFGIWLCVGSPILAEEAAHLGFDWVLLDAQHGYWGHDAMLNACQVVGPTDTDLVIRAPYNDPAQIGIVMDAGTLSIIVPMVNSPEEARRAVAAARYPPEGTRSAASSRVFLYGSDYIQKANDEIMVTVMIETREAAERADEILSVRGVDACLIGPGDLALSMGMFGRETAEHEALIQRVLKAGQKHGVIMGYPSGTVEEALKRADQGFQLLTCGSDIGAFKEGLGRAVQNLKGRGCL